MWLSTGLSNLRNQRAQILLPAVLLAPIFILVIYLLFETAKVSIAKTRNQFALDNAAYSQMSSASAYLNALALINGPLPYRVLLQDFQPIALPHKFENAEPITVFDIFYQGGAFPSIGPDFETGVNPPPAPESNDWGLGYAPPGEWANEHLDCDAIIDYYGSSIVVYAFTIDPEYNSLLGDYRKKKYRNQKILKGISSNGLNSIV